MWNSSQRISSFSHLRPRMTAPRASGASRAAAPERFLSSAFVGQDTLLLDTTGTTGHYKQIRHDPNAVVAALAAGGRRRAVTASVPGPRRRGRSLVIVPPKGTNASVRDYHRAHLLEALIGRFEPDFLSFDRPFAELMGQGGFYATLVRNQYVDDI